MVYAQKDSIYVLGMHYLEQDELQKAQHEFELFEKILPSDTLNYRLAQTFFLMEEDSACESRLLRCLSNSPKYEAPYLLLSQLYDIQDNYLKAYKTLNTYIDLKPENCNGYKHKAYLYLENAGRDAFVSDLLETALFYCNDEEAVEVLLFLADNYFQLNEYQKAKNAYQELLELAPNNPEVQYDVATYFADVGRYQESLDLFVELSNETKHDSSIYFQMGFNAMALEQYEKSIEYYHVYIKYDSLDADGWYNRGLAFASNKNYKQALSDLKTAYEMDPSMDDCLFNIGLIHQNKGEYALGAKYYSDYLSKNHEDPEAMYNRGWCKYNGNDPHGACGDWRRLNQLGYKAIWKQVKTLCDE